MELWYELYKTNEALDWAYRVSKQTKKQVLKEIVESGMKELWKNYKKPKQTSKQKQRHLKAYDMMMDAIHKKLSFTEEYKRLGTKDFILSTLNIFYSEEPGLEKEIKDYDQDELDGLKNRIKTTDRILRNLYWK
ncbi:hypothetical protein JW756_02040 [Candidatus Woesearchaeota archaeon]|nr:hypothetical protein [Candidatus Woesearchaeota archaeon]